MRHLNPVVALVFAAAAVVAFVFGLGTMSFGDLLTEPTVPEAAPDGSTPPGPEADTPDGGILHVSGDRQGTLTLTGGDDIGFGDTTTPWTSADGMEAALGWEVDPESGLYLRHFRLDELDFFLDPDQCAVTSGEIPATPQVPVTIECADIADIRDTAAIALEGVVELPFQFVGVPGITLGGEFTIAGDTNTTVTVPAPYWVVDPEAGEFDELSVFAETADSFFSIGLRRSEAGDLFLSYLQFHDMSSAPPFFEPEPGDCTVTESLVTETGPASAVYDVTVDCPSLTSSDEPPDGMPVGPAQTITLTGAMTAHRLDIEPTNG